MTSLLQSLSRRTYASVSDVKILLERMSFLLSQKGKDPIVITKTVEFCRMRLYTG